MKIVKILFAFIIAKTLSAMKQEEIISKLKSLIGFGLGGGGGMLTGTGAGFISRDISYLKNEQERERIKLKSEDKNWMEESNRNSYRLQNLGQTVDEAENLMNEMSLSLAQKTEELQIQVQNKIRKTKGLKNPPKKIV